VEFVDARLQCAQRRAFGASAPVLALVRLRHHHHGGKLRAVRGQPRRQALTQLLAVVVAALAAAVQEQHYRPGVCGGPSVGDEHLITV